MNEQQKREDFDITAVTTASGAELDRWLAFHGESRLPGEKDESARARLIAIITSQAKPGRL